MVAKPILRIIRNKQFPGSVNYWETRYTSGKTSGAGSYGKLAKFKAEIINAFVKDNGINSVIELGCGDGNQLSLAKYPNYIGMDVSETAIKMCIKRFKGDKSKSFFLYNSLLFKDNHSVFKADLTLSLDVIYHLIEDTVFEKYMDHLFNFSKSWVIIYSNNFDDNQNVHIRPRKLTKYVRDNFPQWNLIKKIKNKYPDESWADFFIYKKLK